MSISNPVQAEQQRLLEWADGLRKQADSIAAVAGELVAGTKWVPVQQAELAEGAVYMVKRVFADRQTEAVASRWTTSNGWSCVHHIPHSGIAPSRTGDLMVWQ